MNLCAPALIYLAFSLTQIIIDTFKGLYNLAFFKIIVMTIITILLNILCQSGMGIVSWIIVFVPFIFMSVIVGILLYVFGFDPETGKITVECNNKVEKKGNLIFSNAPPKKVNPKKKYIDVTYSDIPTEHIDYPYGSSDPQYTD
jgi:hypothetical protein